MLVRLRGKGNTPSLLVGVQTGTTALEITMAISQKVRKQFTSRPFGHIPKGCLIIPQRHMLNYVQSSIVCHSQNVEQPKFPSTKEWIRKMWYIYTMVYYTAENNNDILKFVGKWIDLENIILSEVTKTHKDKYNVYLLISVF